MLGPAEPEMALSSKKENLTVSDRGFKTGGKTMSDAIGSKVFVTKNLPVLHIRSLYLNGLVKNRNQLSKHKSSDIWHIHSSIYSTVLLDDMIFASN